MELGSVSRPKNGSDDTSKPPKDFTEFIKLNLFTIYTCMRGANINTERPTSLVSGLC